ncbi:MAG: methyltransferase domain-containing protein [Planctomycetes bacterium]|nr:methyltransferase domain-containing protein [Planctomycetota bacterium]
MSNQPQSCVSSSSADSTAYCPGCGSTKGRTFFVARDVPVFCNVLWDSHEDALNADRATIELLHCPDCDLVSNTAFDPQKMAYSPQYENSLDCSQRFRTYREELAKRLIADFDLHGKRIVEIGCGRGDFLRLLAELGDNRCVGFDPSYDPSTDPPPSHANVEIRSEFYGQGHSGFDADFVCCRHVLEHIAHPLNFLKQVRDTLGTGSRTPVFFEVPNALYTLERLGIWDLIYEHCLYHTPKALELLFRRSGFECLRVDSVYEGQFVSIDARVDADIDADATVESGTGAGELVAAFKLAYEQKVAHWKNQFETWRSDGKRAVIWGAGSKGVTFLNVMKDTGNVVTHAVDVNPRKQGRFVTGTGQQIVAPAALTDIKPDTVLIMNAIYMAEIQAQLSDMGIEADVQTV